LIKVLLEVNIHNELASLSLSAEPCQLTHTSVIRKNRRNK
jgi:hypothetical protein